MWPLLYWLKQGRVVGYGSSCSTQQFEVIGAWSRSSVSENVVREPMITVSPRCHLWRYIERRGGETWAANSDGENSKKKFGRGLRIDFRELEAPDK